MDIIVTSPKQFMKEAAEEAAECIREGGGHYFHHMARIPKNLRVGDRIWYVEDGYLRGYAIVVSVQEGYVISDATTWIWCKPVPMKGFQGFRYLDPEKAKEIFQYAGNWLYPRPEVEADVQKVWIHSTSSFGISFIYCEPCHKKSCIARETKGVNCKSYEAAKPTDKSFKWCHNCGKEVNWIEQ